MHKNADFVWSTKGNKLAYRQAKMVTHFCLSEAFHTIFMPINFMLQILSHLKLLRYLKDLENQFQRKPIYMMKTRDYKCKVLTNHSRGLLWLSLMLKPLNYACQK